MPPRVPASAGRLDRHDHHLLVRRRRHRPQRIDVFFGDEEVGRREVALRDRLADHRGRLGLGLGLALARLGVAEGGLLAALGGQDLRLLLALGAQDLRLPQALRLQHRGALLALGLHLARHRAGEIRPAAGCP